MEDIWKPVRTHLVKFNAHSLLSILGWPKSLFGFLCTILWKNLNNFLASPVYTHIYTQVNY